MSRINCPRCGMEVQGSRLRISTHQTSTGAVCQETGWTAEGKAALAAEPDRTRLTVPCPSFNCDNDSLIVQRDQAICESCHRVWPLVQLARHELSRPTWTVE